MCMAPSAVACLSEVIASLFMVACRQQCLISALNGAASDSRSKCLCSVSLILHSLRSWGGVGGRGGGVCAGPGLRAAKRPGLVIAFSSN